MCLKHVRPITSTCAVPCCGNHSSGCVNEIFDLTELVRQNTRLCWLISMNVCSDDIFSTYQHTAGLRPQETTEDTIKHQNNHIYNHHIVPTHAGLQILWLCSFVTNPTRTLVSSIPTHDGSSHHSHACVQQHYMLVHIHNTYTYMQNLVSRRQG